MGQDARFEAWCGVRMDTDTYEAMSELSAAVETNTEDTPYRWIIDGCELEIISPYDGDPAGFGVELLSFDWNEAMLGSEIVEKLSGPDHVARGAVEKALVEVLGPDHGLSVDVWAIPTYG